MKSFCTIFHFALVLGILCCKFSTSKSHGEPVPLSYFCVNITYGDEHNNNVNNNGDKSPILLIHGLHGYKEEWMDFIHILAIKTGRRLCALDLRNHGASPWSDEYDIPTMAEDVNLLLKTINIEKVALLGHSLGGKVSVQFALTYPEKIEKLIIEDMRPNGITDDVRAYLNRVEVFENISGIIPEGCTEKEAKKIVYEHLKRHWEAQDDVLFYYPIICSDGNCRIQPNIKVIENMRLAKDLDLGGSTGVCDKPTLFIYGEKSPFKVRDVEEEIMQLFPKAKLVEVKGAGHVLQPFMEFKEKVINFFNDEE